MRRNTICKSCGIKFEYETTQSRGMFCTNKCQQTFIITEKVKNGVATFRTARSYKLRFEKYECEECGLDKWRKKKLILHLDHKDGDRKNNAQKNLRWLCPNCHSQTKTWGSQNISDAARQRMHAGGERGRQTLYGGCSLTG